jgi:hypothetical protein
VVVSVLQLSPAQKQTFKKQGYLVIRDAIPETALSSARDAVWNDLDVSRDEPEECIGKGYDTCDPLSADSWETLVETTKEYAEALVGQGTLTTPDHRKAVHLQYPDSFPFDGVTRRRTTMGHLDGYGPVFRKTGKYNGFTVGSMVYLDDVDSGGGGFTVWPGTHWIAAEYFSEHSLASAGMGGFLPALADHGWDYESRLTEDLQPVELTGDAGTLILWHNKLMHVAGVNQSERLRMAALMGYTRFDHDEIYEDAADKLWKYWDGLDDVSIDIDPTR